MAQLSIITFKSTIRYYCCKNYYVSIPLNRVLVFYIIVFIIFLIYSSLYVLISIFQLWWLRRCSSFRCDDAETDDKLRKRRRQPVPCLAEGAAMSSLLMLLLLGLLARAPLLVCAQSPPVFVLTELCHYSLNIDYIEHQLGNFSMRMLPPEGKQSVVIYCLARFFLFLFVKRIIEKWFGVASKKFVVWENIEGGVWYMRHLLVMQVGHMYAEYE